MEQSIQDKLFDATADQRFNLYEQWDKRMIATNISIEEVAKIVREYARRDNFGIYRHWRIGNLFNYDCGPVTLVAEMVKNNDEKTN